MSLTGVRTQPAFFVYVKNHVPICPRRPGHQKPTVNHFSKTFFSDQSEVCDRSFYVKSMSQRYEFSEEEIRRKLEELGYSNIPDNKLKEFQRGLL